MHSGTGRNAGAACAGGSVADTVLRECQDVSPALPFKVETWEAVIRRAVPPKSVDVNLEAFRLGVATAGTPTASCAASGV